MSLAGSLSIVILRRDRCVYRETTADSSTKTQVGSRFSYYCDGARLADIWSGYKSDREGGGGGGGRVEAWLRPSPKYRLSY